MFEAGGRAALPVVATRSFGPDLLILELERPREYSFRAGQACDLELAGEARPFSIVSAPSADTLEFLVRAGPGFPARLAGLQPGDTVGVSAAYGGFELCLRRPHLLMVASGTGIAPYISMLREHLSRGRPTRHFHLLHGASFRDSLAYEDELRAYAELYPSHVRYAPSLSRPGAPRNREWRGLQGRVEHRVASYAHRHDLKPGNCLVYACGRRETVAEVQTALRGAFEFRGEAY